MGAMTIEAMGLANLTHKVVVGIADMAVSNNATVTLATHALGSCIGVSVFDPVVRVGGLLHYMLPGVLDRYGKSQIPAADVW